MATHTEESSEKNLFGIPLAVFKTPAAMLLLGIIIATGGNFGINKLFSSEPSSIQGLELLKQDIQNLKEDRAETKAQISSLKEQSSRIESKLDRLLERSLYSRK